MKEPKFIQLPREIWMGPGVLKEVCGVCERLGLDKRAVLVADETTYKIAGKKVEKLLKTRGIDVFPVMIANATVDEVEKIRKAGKSEFYIGVGGGRAIDVAKLASFLERKPFISVPTAASHDGIASSRASIKGGKKSTSVETHAPLAIIADTLIIKKAPHRLLAAGCGDLLANFTAVWDWQLAHRVKGEPYSEYAATLSLVSAQIVMDNAGVIKKHSEESVRKVVKALISSSVAMAIAGSSRPASGAEHLFSHALDAVAAKPALHGEQCGVGAIMMARLHGKDWKKIKKALETVGAPTTAREIGVRPEEVIEALMLAPKIRPERYTILGRGLRRNAAIKLAKETGVI
ncbi:MAG: NAD(P)-dependent glycerol-1-phosphate dehydrogenase [Candidatus Hadarchaeales archaeon]